MQRPFGCAQAPVILLALLPDLSPPLAFVASAGDIDATASALASAIVKIELLRMKLSPAIPQKE
jgi:hypothetical protein